MSRKSSIETSLPTLDYSPNNREEETLLDAWGEKGIYDEKFVEEQIKPRPSFRLMVVHLLHGLLLLVSVFTLLVSFYRWEHSVAVNTDIVSQVTSYISISVQAFFTGATLVLYLLSSGVAIDSAIRHPRSLVDLDFRLQAWYGGMGPAIANGVFQIHRFRHISRSVLLGVPVYFAAGEILKLSSSSALGINIYSFNSSLSGAARSHTVPFLEENFKHVEQEPWNCSEDTVMNARHYRMTSLWTTANQILHFDKTIGNDSTHPGLIGNTLYDVPDSSALFDSVQVNATKLAVHCSHIDAAETVFGFTVDSLSPISNGYYVRWNSTPDPSPFMTAEVSLRPAYGIMDSSLSNDTLSSLYFDLPVFLDITQVLLQPWSFDGYAEYRGVSNQLILVIASNDTGILLHDRSNNAFSTNTTYLTPSEDCLDLCTQANLDKDSVDCVNHFLADSKCMAAATPTTWNFQALGCSLHTNQSTLSIIQSGLVSNTSFGQTQPSPAHDWDDYVPSASSDSDDFLAREFLEMFVPSACTQDTGETYQNRDLMSGILLYLLRDTNDLNVFENTLANMTASYLWNVWQQCSSHFKYGWDYPQCNIQWNTSALMSDSSLDITSAKYANHDTRARLEIVQWKAAVTVLCALVLCFLSVYLLGTRTDATRGVPLRQARFLEMSRLLNGSEIPELVANAKPGFEKTSIRYIRGAGEQSTARLDVYR